MYYIFNKNGNYMGNVNLEPDLSDLTIRQEQVVESELIFNNPILINGIIKEAEIPLFESRQKIRDAINALRDQKINGGVYVPAIDKWIDSDTRAVQNLLSVKATFDLFGDDLDIVWTCADNSNIKMTKEVMLQIWQAMQHNINTNHGNAISHKNALEQSENPLEYDYSSGWTQTYEEFVGAANE